MVGVIGGTRFIGRFLIDALVDSGESVMWLIRDPARASGLVSKDVELVRFDLEQILEHLSELDCVISAAPIRMAERVLEVCRVGGIRRAVFLSSAWRYSLYATEQVEAVIRGETLVMDSDLVWAILRPAMINGPGDRNVSVIREQILQRSVLPVIGSGEPLGQLVHVEDIAFAISATLPREGTHRTCYDLGGPEAMTCSQMIDEIASCVGKHPLKLYVPMFVAATVAWVMEKFVRDTKVTRDRVRRMREDRHLDVQEATNQQAYYPRDFTDGLRDSGIRR